MAINIPDPIRKQCEEKGGLEGIIAKLPEARSLKARAKLFQALGDPMRLKILFALDEQPLCACLIREVLGISDSKLSYHLTVLKQAKLIAGKKQGQWIIYGLTELGNQVVRMIGKF
ncbi:MAG: metalloregulator ArsR/SmtB family transcription factor [Candidatus Thermoplasmatota archaeon]|nr:winged helix-turn-helix transcriptional regulator [Euryarchaeota archaeon]MBU4031835.1 metalloregulator ArsR/SmtB family transcription factor [Candidatus Thermoplasmatota archaeon]MBU4071075.1 metalloregulator ArsR/SmtB family transcription factor [Candidatus Thermoplasmatota archaeon]MBU4145186.1 metalloregulator ArsR/SmtB family transcription factor [Candidatus Thermoplasmatota archaeon]MBU4591137.1 metalloregulator ArsR/SmtB family transcription factor [Candidatus Thermoplasmatota archaeo